MATNECIPFKHPGANVTGRAVTAVIGKRFLAVSGDIGADGRIGVQHATTGRAVGVAAYDAAVGKDVGVIRGARIVVPVTAGQNMAAGTEVGPDAQGRAVPAGSNPATGYLETAATANADARVCMY